jgi:hypothetical protein
MGELSILLDREEDRFFGILSLRVYGYRRLFASRGRLFASRERLFSGIGQGRKNGSEDADGTSPDILGKIKSQSHSQNFGRIVRYVKIIL